MRLQYTPAAILDLQEIRGYICDALLNPQAAQSVLRSIADSCAKLKEQPLMGMELCKKFNREIEGYCIVVGKYLVVYDVGEVVSVLRVLDTRTDYARALFS